MTEESKPSLNALKITYDQLAFIHSVLTQRTQYFLQEVDIAKEAAKTITDMANKLADEIKAQEEANKPKEEQLSLGDVQAVAEEASQVLQAEQV